ncbi:MAG: Csu type fimbrial protein [Gammaproteobacteria bacterium]
MNEFMHCKHAAAGPGSGSPSAGRRVGAAILALAMSGAADSVYGASCSVSTIGDISFGVYDVFSPGANDATGKINVLCEDILVIGVTYTILLSTGASGSYAPRAMSDGSGHTLDYNLYTDANRVTPVWGDGTGGTGTVSGIFGIGLFSRNRDHDVYGRIPAGQNVNVGNYSDTITVTVNY